MLAYFDFYCPGRKLVNDTSQLTSYDGTELHKNDEGSDQLLVKGKILTVASFRGESLLPIGTLSPVAISLLPPSPFITKPRKK